ncbi:hypothetical protein NQZ68_032311 [Dissostichus eleginoides]|nr:hypothetical protein NQZ68_032311 [Dissostichus eleginoides]
MKLKENKHFFALPDDCALQLSHNGSYLDLESTLAEQKDELEGFQEEGGGCSQEKLGSVGEQREHPSLPSEIVRSLWKAIESCEVKVVHFFSRRGASLPELVSCQLALTALQSQEISMSRELKGHNHFHTMFEAQL